MFKSGCPQRLWRYGVPYLDKVMQQTAIYYGNLDGRTPIEKITGQTPDIYKYIDFSFYDWVIYKNEAGLRGVFLGIRMYV